MATPGIGYFGPTGNKLVDGMTHGYYWTLGPDRTIDWSFSLGPAGETWDLAGAAMNRVGNALYHITGFANVDFNYAKPRGSIFHSSPDAAAQAGSEINVALADSSLFSDPTSAGRGLYPFESTDGLYAGAAGDIYFNASAAESYLSSGVVLREIGRALGLKDPTDSEGGRPTLDLNAYLDVYPEFASVMFLPDPFSGYDFVPVTLMILDVLALQALYGKNMTDNAGDSTISLSSYQYDGRSHAFLTIWDPSGNDTLEVGALSPWYDFAGWEIVLPNQALSELVDTKVGYAVRNYIGGASPRPDTFAWLAGDIENAVGSRGNDVITGSDGPNMLTGGGGVDQIDGGLGIDVAAFSGQREHYTISRSGSTIIVSGESSDPLAVPYTPYTNATLVNVERLQFADMSIAYDVHGAAGQAYRLYQAAFNRTPDLAGLGYQMHALDGGLSLLQIAQNFMASPEFASTYGSLSTAAFVTQLYANVLHRTPDAAGLEYHVTNIEGGMSRAQVLANFSESPENQAAVIGSIANGMIYII